MIELCLASQYSEKINAAGWLASDKLDGVRCLWNGKELYTRNGKLLKPPSYFISELPASPMDGELYIPENILSELSKGNSYQGLRFDTTTEKVIKSDHSGSETGVNFSPSSILSSIILSQDELGWLLLTFWVFDAPAISMPFKHRLSSLSTFFGSAKNTFVRLLPFSPVKDNAEVQARLASTSLEGLVLRNPNSMYERKRCWSMVKVKKVMDAEFEVVGTCVHPYGKHPKRSLQLKSLGKGRPGVVLKGLAYPKHEFVLVNGVTKSVQAECLKAKDQGNQIQE